MRNFLSILFITIALLVPGSQACQVPVFRYALERWESDTYQLFITKHGPLTPTQTETVTRFQEKLKHCNLKLNILDTSRLSEGQLWQLPEIDTSEKQAKLHLFQPESAKQTKPLLVTDLSEQKLTHLIDSPARSHIVTQLLAGNSCVWLILHQNQEDKAKQLQSQLDGYLRDIEKEITIPEGIIGTEERHRIDEDTDLEDVLRSSIPLKIAFSSAVLNAKSPEEKAFVAQLLRHSPATANSNNEPLIIPVFGRGRQLPAMPASLLSLDTLRQGCQYLCGACSCQVKEQNPGADLLIHENWASHLTSGLAVVDKELPPLQGAGDLTNTANKTTSSPAGPEKPNFGEATASKHNAEGFMTDDPIAHRFPVWITLASLLALVILGSFIVVKKKTS